MIYQKVNNEWKPVYAIYQKNSGSWQEIPESTFRTFVTNNVWLFGGSIENFHTLTIAGLSNVSGESCTYSLIYDSRTDVSSAATWSLLEGTNYATISGNQLTILSGADGSDVMIYASYDGVIATKVVTVTYKSGTSTETETITETDEGGNTTTTTTSVTTNEDGSSETTSTSTSYDESGNTTGTSESTVIVNEDGSSSSNTVTTQYDESGNTIGSSENNTVTNTDGSYNSNTTNYDENGDATDATNTTGDTEGNVDTQEVEYENGEPVVTAYTIDTTNSSGGTKTINGGGTNTEYYAFDMTHGFILHINFRLFGNNQPPGQNENHHQILSMKRTSPQPWYGFQLRHSNTASNIVHGTQFSGGSNTNTNITIPSDGIFDITITYNPTASTNNYICYDNRNKKNIYVASRKFPDIPELRYIKVTIGYALDSDGNPYRYSNMDLFDFSITRTD